MSSLLRFPWSAYISLPVAQFPAFSTVTTMRFNFKFKMNGGGYGNNYPWSFKQGSVKTHCFHNNVTTGSDTLTFYASGGYRDTTTTYTNGDTIEGYMLLNLSTNNMTVVINGITEINDTVTSLAGYTDGAPFDAGTIGWGQVSPGTSHYSFQDFYYLGIDINGTPLSFWDADSPTSNGAGTTLYDTVGTAHGTQAGTWPADNSEWVSYGASDTEKPVVVLDPATLTYNLTEGDTFTLPTSTLTDNVDTTITITPFSNDVNTSTAGAYTVVYSGYTDAAGNEADPVTINVNVAAAGQSIAIESIPFLRRVYQRKANNYATITKNITYVGSPTALQYRVINSVSLVTLVDWTTFDASPTGGTATLSFEMVGSMSQYLVDVRFSNAVGITAREINWWTVGDIILAMGQSLARRLESDGTITKLTGYWQWNSVNVTDDKLTGIGQKAIAQTIIERDGVHVVVVNTAVGGSSITAWNGVTNTYGADSLAEINTLTQGENKIAYIHWHQGNQDANSGMSAVDYTGHLTAFFNQMRAVLTTADSTTLPIISAVFARDVRAITVQRPIDFQVIRGAQLAYIESDANTYGFNAYPIALVDGVHQTDASNLQLGTLAVNTYLNVLNGETTKNMQIVSAVLATATRIVITYDNDLLDEGPYSLEGVRVLDENLTVLTVASFTRTSIRTATITLSAAITTATATFYLGYGCGATYDALIYPTSVNGIITPAIHEMPAMTATANVAPTADAGSNQTGITAGATVTLDFSGSTDGDGTIASYAVTQTAGDTVTLSGTGASRTFTAPTTGSAQTLTFSLVVTDDDGADSTPDTVDIGVLAEVIADATAPVITLTGASTISLDVGDTYTELGATAADNVDGDITGSIVITGTVDTATAGTYTKYYNVSDAADNAATEVTRSIIVSVIAPTITINSLGSLTVGDSGTATATTTNTTSIAWSSTGGLTINASTGAYTAASEGAFTLNATATGDGGSTDANEVSGTIAAVVIPDTTKPVIVLSPSTLTYNLTVGDTFTLPTATLTDNVDSTISISPVSNNVNTSVATDVTPYQIVYSGYEDAAGNIADSVTITVNVFEVTGLLEEVAQTLFSINKKLYTAFKGRGNIETLKFKPIEPIQLIEVDADGYFDFDNNEVTKVEFILGGASIDTESTFLSFDGSQLNVETGALDIESSPYSATVIVYIGSDTKGTVICGPGLTANCVIDFR